MAVRRESLGVAHQNQVCGDVGCPLLPSGTKKSHLGSQAKEHLLRNGGRSHEINPNTGHLGRRARLKEEAINQPSVRVRLLLAPLSSRGVKSRSTEEEENIASARVGYDEFIGGSFEREMSQSQRASLQEKFLQWVKV